MFEPPTDEYRAALTAAGHPDLDAGRISRLVQRMPRGCDECGSLVRYRHHDDSMIEESETRVVDACGCGLPWTEAMEMRADLCPRCGMDPDTCVRPICTACSEPVERNRPECGLPWGFPSHKSSAHLQLNNWEDDFRALREGRLACFKCHDASDEDCVHGCECRSCTYDWGCV